MAWHHGHSFLYVDLCPERLYAKTGVAWPSPKVATAC